MKVFSIIVFGTGVKPPIIISQASDLSSFGFFKRGTIKEFILFVSREIISRTNPGERQTVTHQSQEAETEKFLCHAFVNPQNVGCVTITDGDYPTRVAHGLMLKALEAVFQAHGADVANKYSTDANLNTPELETMLSKYQQPEQVDSMMQIEKDLDATKGILMKSIDQLLVRGEKLEDLAAKSNDLSFQSKAFMQKSKDLNSCCVII